MTLLVFSETAGVEDAEAFLKSQHCDPHKIDSILKIIEGVSFKNELGAKACMFSELAVVQDADRLDGNYEIIVYLNFV